MRHLLRHCRPALILGATLLGLVSVGCAPTTSSSDAPKSPVVISDKVTDPCAKPVTVQPGVLTIATDSPAYDPWFSGNDPTNGKGFESAVAYAVADQLGFDKSEVTWVKVPFNNSYAPGTKKFDFDINQASITPGRGKAVDFSDGYYSAAQAVIALKSSPASSLTSLADLKDLKLGAQTGTTSL